MHLQSASQTIYTPPLVWWFTQKYNSMACEVWSFIKGRKRNEPTNDSESLHWANLYQPLSMEIWVGVL